MFLSELKRTRENLKKKPKKQKSVLYVHIRTIMAYLMKWLITLLLSAFEKYTMFCFVIRFFMKTNLQIRNVKDSRSLILELQLVFVTKLCSDVYVHNVQHNMH